MWRWLCLFLGFAFKLHLLPKFFLKKRLEGEVLHRAGRQVITSLIAYASCSYFDPKKKKKKIHYKESNSPLFGVSAGDSCYTASSPH